MMKFSRELAKPKKTFFLFGPRGTGKSTWLKQNFPDATWFNLLNSELYLKLNQNPGYLLERTAHLSEKSWVVIDEVQRIPELLNIVHSLYEDKKLNFALSGSSARKLKRAGANLLAGRALQHQFFTLIYPEYQNHLQISDLLNWGTLPLVVTDETHRRQTLAAYVETYLRQELVQEGIIRKLDPFARFLQVAGIYNAQVLNLENISNRAKVPRSTVQSYFEILEETLIGFLLRPYQPGEKVKEVFHPKFYFFDPGVARSCAGLFDEPLDSFYLGFQLETFILNEVKAYNHYAEKYKNFYYYKVSGGYEIDLLIELKAKTINAKPSVIPVEIKLSKTWDKKWNSPLKDFCDSKKIHTPNAYGIYMGEDILTFDKITVLPVLEFLKRLHSSEIF